jgi:hypothetical protein
LLLQLQQARGPTRIIGSGLDAHAGVDLLLGFDHRREVVLVGGAGRLKNWAVEIRIVECSLKDC